MSVWKLDNGSHLFDLSGEHSTSTHCTSMADGGNLAITGSADSCVYIWDLKSPPVSQTSKYHNSDTLTVAISPCGLYAVSGGADSFIKVYDFDSMEVLKELCGHKGAVNHVVVMRDSKHLLSASSDGSINLWNGETEEVVSTFSDGETSCQVNCVAISADSELLMSGNEDGQVMFWSMKSGKLLKTFINHKSAIVSVAFAQSPTAKYIMSASKDGQVCTRDFHTAKVILSKQTHIDDLLCLAVSRDASLYATGSRDKECHIVSLPGGSLKSILTGHEGSVRSLRLLQAGKWCITASEDCMLRLWDVSQSQCIATLHADLPILCCDLDRHEANILYGTKDGCVSTALYHDQCIEDSARQHPILRRIKGIESPSSSSFTETDSSQCSKVMETSQEAKLQPPTVYVIDPSSIPLPPSDDEGSLQDKNVSCSQTSSIIQLSEDTNLHISHLDNGITPNPTGTTTATNTNRNEKLPYSQAFTEQSETNDNQKQLLEKLMPDMNGFIEPDVSKMLKIKSDITESGHGSLHDVQEEETQSEPSRSSSKSSLPTSSSLCTLL